jgi:hypothetical protein
MSRMMLYVLNKYIHCFGYYNETEYSKNFLEHLVNTKCSFIVHPVPVIQRICATSITHTKAIRNQLCTDKGHQFSAHSLWHGKS